ncbi:ion transporter [bacterium]|nr:MAG: ion transporter [bacterium]
MWDNNTPKNSLTFRARMHQIIFEADTIAGKIFDIILLIVILLSVIVVMLESVASVEWKYGNFLRTAEWVFTIIFTIEYILRLWCVRKSLKYAFSFYGIVDFFGFIPTYISIFVPGTHFLIVIRIIRLVRIFRIFKLTRYLREGQIMLKAIRASKPKIIVFLVSVLTAVITIGSMMYLIEGAEHGFSNIPKSIYWAVVTMTTVGYGDISPQTPLGQFLSMIVMILGYAIIAVPTGIISFDIMKTIQDKVSTQVCPECSREGHDSDAKYCKFCGSKL